MNQSTFDILNPFTAIRMKKDSFLQSRKLWSAINSFGVCKINQH